MKIILSPVAAMQQDVPPTVTGNTISYRGEDYDLSELPVGATVEADLPFIGSITNNDGEIELTLQYQYDTSKAEPMQSTDIADYTLVVTEGLCPDPIVYKPEPEPVVEPETVEEQAEETENDN